MNKSHAPNKNVIVFNGDENVCNDRSISQVKFKDDVGCVSVKRVIKCLLNKCLSCKSFTAKSEKMKSRVRLKGGERMLGQT